jgi:hypothetical protein
MVGITAGAFGQLMYDEPLGTVLLGLLGDNYWGEQAPAVDSCVRSFLVAAWVAREAAVAARGPATVLEVTLDAEPGLLPALPSVRVRVPVGPAAGPVGPAKKAVLIVIRGGVRVVWYSATRVCVGITSPVGLLWVRCPQWTGCVTLVTLWLPLLQRVVPSCTTTAGNGARAHGARAR